MSAVPEARVEVPRAPAAPPTARPALTEEDRITLRPAHPPSRAEPVVGVPPAAGLVRARLTAVLDRALRARICAVVAPAGAGKTSALAHWAGQTSAAVAWFRARPDRTDPASALLDGLAAAVHAADPRLPRAAGWDSLVEVCARHEGLLVLVVDDLHHLAGPGTSARTAAVGTTLERLLLETERVSLVVASRVAPPLNMARTELASAVVGSADLRFRPAETATLFRDGYDLPLSESDARVLTRRTGGWAAALHLFHHTVAGRAGEARHRSVQALGHRDHYAREYLARTVLADLTPEELHFLRRTATLEVLTGELCDRLLGAGASQQRLVDLGRRGVVVPADVGAGLCLPEVVRSHLLAALRTEAGDEVTDAWFRTTAGLLVDRDGGQAAAVRASIAGHDWSTAVDTARTHWTRVIADPDLDWADAVATRPTGREVLVARAVRARRDGALDDAAAWAGEATALAPDATDPVARSAREVSHFCRTWTAGDLQPGEHWSDYLRAALRRPDPSRRTGLDPASSDVLRAFEHAVAGSWAQARSLLHGSAGRLDDDPATGCAADLLAAALNPTDPERTDAISARAADLGLAWFARLADRLAGVLRGDAVATTDGVREADDRGDRWGALLLCGLAALRRVRGGLPATDLFDDLVRRCRELDAPALEAWVRAGAALCSAAAHLPDSARDAESSIGFAHSAQVPGALAVAYAAAALSRSDAELRRLADDEAGRLGLDVRPWEWLDPAPPAGPPAAVVARTPPVEVRCFGGYEVLVDGEVPDLARVRPRARALLRLLSLYAGQPVHREVIVDAMWPQLDPAAATHNLHVCISGLRVALEPGAPRGGSRLVVRDGERYLLALPDGAVSDLRSFDASTAAARRARNAGAPERAVADLEEALRLYTGEVLPEDGPTEWVLPHREQYKVRAAEAAAMLGRLHLDRGRPDDAAAAARRSIDVDPCRDASWRLLVAAHVAAGDLAASEEARRSYAEVLASLGVVSSVADVIRVTPRPG